MSNVGAIAASHGRKHPDLRGHQPDPARGDGQAAAEVAAVTVRNQYLLNRRSPLLRPRGARQWVLRPLRLSRRARDGS
jgi:hypothetical protein